jgi:glycosyltransferase involved in cell wall biosynthesis
MAEKTAEYWGEGSFRWRTLHNPFSTSPATRFTDGDYVLSFGRLAEEKGVEQLISAAALMPGIPVRIVGSGPFEDALRSQAAEAGLPNVEFLGPVWGDDLDRVLDGARLVCVPSRWHENFPYVVLQSFAAGKPVVGAERGGIPEMLGEGARGLTYHADDPAALADAVRGLWDDRSRRERMSEAARAYIGANFGDANFMSELMHAYETALDPAAPASPPSES